MAGRGTISVNQTPQYGDKSKLEKLGKPLTKMPMTGNLTEAPSAGRPVSTGAGAKNDQPPVQRQQTGTATVDPEHQTLMQQYAQAFRTNQYWQGVVSQYPSEWSKMYAQEAADILSRVQSELRNATPFFE